MVAHTTKSPQVREVKQRNVDLAAMAEVSSVDLTMQRGMGTRHSLVSTSSDSNELCFDSFQERRSEAYRKADAAQAERRAEASKQSIDNSNAATAAANS